MTYVLVQGQEINFPAQQSGRETKRSLSPHLGSIQVLNGWDDARQPRRGSPALPSLQIQTLISSRNTAQTHPEIVFNQVAGHPVAQGN